MKRRISHSEINTALECWARWDFAYGGRLAGDALVRKQAALRLREGRAWGRAVAALHAVKTEAPTLPGLSPPARLNGDPSQEPPPAATCGGSTSSPGGRLGLDSLQRAHRALHDALEEDAAQQREHGFYDQTEHIDIQLRLGAILSHYAATSEPLQAFSPELELLVPLPSRTGVRASNRYDFHGFLDALIEEERRLWIVEYKLRGRLTDLEQIALGRQYRRYAWAAEQILDRQVAGVIVDERLNEAPKPARWVKGRKKTDPDLVPSHAKDQLTTPELYEQACAEAGVQPDPDTVTALGQRRWQARHRVIFRRSEIEEAGWELVAAAQLIAQLDTGALWPIRHPSPQRCNACAYREICPTPDDRELVDLSYERIVPKRDRSEEEEPIAA